LQLNKTARGTAASLERLQRRDRAVLVAYSLSAFAVIIAGELLAFYFDLAQRIGFVPIAVRGIAYLAVTTALWAVLLRGNRRLVGSLLREVRDGYESVLFAYEGAISLKDAYTDGHGRRVAACAERIATALGQSPEQANEVREAGLLHDLGKIGVPDAILTKPAALDAAEMAEMRRHPVAGARILEAIPALRRHAATVRHHHERYDGKGYPDTLAGELIPLGARIIAVADAWDALTSDRSYRRALPRHAALAELTSQEGTQFDPEVVGALRQVLTHVNQKI
jgi:HD-GYP domain-containing protein (c-di-GMP phosphodiesterase class II)